MKFFSCLLILLFLISCKPQLSNELLIEAESFTKKGGWVVDPQFTEQMGSPYLLAHGLGNPVENASISTTYHPLVNIMYGPEPVTGLPENGMLPAGSGLQSMARI